MSRFDLQHFDRAMPIVDPDTGLPTPYFLQMLFGNTGNAQDNEDSLASLLARQIIAGAGLDGGGPLSDDVTIDANASAILDLISSTRGTVLYRGASAWSALAPGTVGQVLQTGGAGADPSWVNATAGGALVLLDSFVSNGSESTKTFSSISGAYKDLIISSSARGSTAATTVGLNLTFNGDTGANYDRQRAGAINAAADGAQGVGVNNIPLAVTGSSAPSNVPCLNIGTIVQYADTTFHKTCYFDYAFKTANSSGGIQNQSMAGFWRSTSAITSMTFTLVSGTFVSGSTIYLYGRA